MILDFAHNHPSSMLAQTSSTILTPRTKQALRYNFQPKRTMMGIARHIANLGMARKALPSTRGFAFNSAHVKQGAAAKVQSDPDLTPEEKQKICGELQRLKDHEHPLYVELDPSGKCIAAGTITGNPPFDGRPVSPEHIESQGVQIQDHARRGPQFALPFKEDYTTQLETKHLNVGPEVVADGTDANAELSKGIEPLKEKLNSKID